MCLAVIDGIYVFFILFNISVAIYLRTNFILSLVFLFVCQVQTELSYILYKVKILLIT